MGHGALDQIMIQPARRTPPRNCTASSSSKSETGQKHAWSAVPKVAWKPASGPRHYAPQHPPGRTAGRLAPRLRFLANKDRSGNVLAIG